MPVSRETLIERYFPHSVQEVSRYAEFLVGPGIERGLIGPREGEIIWERHIFNCLPVTSLLTEGASVIDIGSGAGLPGIVIALARPDVHVTLVEPLERRVEFLNEFITNNPSIANVEVIRGQAQDVKKQADFVTARAVAPLDKLKKMSWHLIKKGGSLVAMKGQSAAAEIEKLPHSLKQEVKLHEITLEGLEAGRVVAIRKLA